MGNPFELDENLINNGLFLVEYFSGDRMIARLMDSWDTIGFNMDQLFHALGADRAVISVVTDEDIEKVERK